MKIQRLSNHDFSLLPEPFHCLTYAEEGFSPLNLFTKNLEIDSLVLNDFATQINERDEVASLHPRAPISCVPRRCVRDHFGYRDLENHIKDFLIANEKTVGSRRLVIDFGVPRLHRDVWKVLDNMDQNGEFNFFDKVVVIDNDQ